MSASPIQHSAAFRRRRLLNWLPLGLTYAFLYMGRYNMTVAKNAFGDLMPKDAFGIISAAGTITYAVAFLINGPLTDKIGGRRTILIAAIGAAIMNLLLAAFTYYRPAIDMVTAFSVLYAANMYFQSFGAVSIVKVNSSWFHVRERGIFGGIFGILISAGIYFAFDWGYFIVEKLHTTVGADGAVAVSPPHWVFAIPAFILLLFALIDTFLVFDRPSQVGLADFDTGDASSGEDDCPDPLKVILKKVVTNPIVLTIGAIEFCTGVLRNGVMHWYSIYGKEMGYYADFVITRNWGLMLFLAGATGGMVAGWLSDHVFGSRRGPVAGLLYALMLGCVVVMAFSLQNMWVLGICVILISFCVIGTHGMLSGTATMDFGGRKNAGTAVGLIDGLVYLGTGTQFLTLGFLVERTELSWRLWPPFLIPFALLGTLLAWRIRHAIPKRSKSGGH